ncbi:putative ribonuclease H-like domain-containing protein, partial [Tanacetum coccineum]
MVDLPNGKRAIGTKKDERGIVVRNKARLVAQGYTQEEGIDYDEVFAPIARIEAIRLFLAYALFIGLIVYQMDVKSAFLYGTIEAELLKPGMRPCLPTYWKMDLEEQKLCSALSLALPEGSENFVVYRNASHKGLGAVLMQREKANRDDAQAILDEFYRGAHFLLRIASTIEGEWNLYQPRP